MRKIECDFVAWVNLGLAGGDAKLARDTQVRKSNRRSFDSTEVRFAQDDSAFDWVFGAGL